MTHPTSGPTTAATPLYLDATKLSKLLACRRKYTFAHEAGAIEADKDKDALALGVSLHTLAEVWNNLPSDWDRDEAFKAFVPYALQTGVANGLKPASQAHDKRRSLEALLDVTTEYCHRTDIFKTALDPEGNPAQEMHFKIPTGRVWGDPATYQCYEIVLCGYIDRVVLDELDNSYGFDYKSTLAALTTHWATQFSSSVQMNLYMWALYQLGYKPKGLMICGMQPLVSGARVSVLPVIGGSRKLVESRIDGVLDNALAALDLEAMTPNTNSCHGMYACEYYAVCNAWGSHREAIIREDYRLATTWQPEIAREPAALWYGAPDKPQLTAAHTQ